MTPPFTELLDQHSVKRRVKQLEICFLDLIDCTYEILVEKGIDVHRLHAWLVSLDVSRKHEHKEFIDSHLMNINQGVTFSNLWTRLGNYCNFLNFDLLEHVVGKFGSEDLKHKMESYESDLQSFRKSTRLRDFIDCWPVRGQTPPVKELREFVAKVEYRWDNCTLEDLDMLEGVITRKFFLPKFALQVKEIKEGCIVITWLIPAPFIEALQEAIETTSSEFFVEHRIQTITIFGKKCYPSPIGKTVDNPKEQSTSHSSLQPQKSDKPPVSTISEKLHPFKPGTAPSKETHMIITSINSIPTDILQNMRELHLSEHKLDGSACELLAKAVPSMFRLEELWLGSNPIGSGGAVKVIKALCSSRVKQLWLHNTGIGLPDCIALCELLKSTQSLHYLSIYQNNFSSECVASIITGLSHNSSLTDLNISNSHFSMSNVVSLASILRDQSKCTLTGLELRDCHIGGKGACELAAALSKKLTLKRFVLNYNPIGVEGASSMSDMLQHNTSLWVLHMLDESIGEEGVYQLINSLKHNQTLWKLWLPKKYKIETSDHRVHWGGGSATKAPLFVSMNMISSKFLC